MNATHVERRISQWRWAVWTAILIPAYFGVRDAYPLAWQAAAFGAIFALLWSRVQATRAASPASSPERTGRLIEAGVDLLTITALTHQSGGFRSPFAFLYVLGVLESAILLGSPTAFGAAASAALLNALHFRTNGVSSPTLLLYGSATFTFFIAAGLASWGRQAAPALEGEADESGASRGRSRKKRGESLGMERTVEELENLLEEEYAAHRQLKDTYREVARLHREQKAQIEQMERADVLFHLSATAGQEEGGANPQSALLKAVMDTLDAGGGVLWTLQGEALTLRLTEGRVVTGVTPPPIPNASTLPPIEVRAACEEQMASLAPATPKPAQPKSPAPTEEVLGWRVRDILLEPEEATEAPVRARPHLVALLYSPKDSPQGSPRLLGAVGICDPRGAARFSQTDQERLMALAMPLSRALLNLEQRRDLLRSLQGVQALYRVARISQSATDVQAIYQAVVTQAQQLLSAENCTLFLLDQSGSALVARATYGREVNLLHHLGFERGSGVSGWVASNGRPLAIPDLQQRSDLRAMEEIPPRVRSFVATPLRVQNRILGVLNVSHAQPNVFAPEDIQMLGLLAEQAVLSLSQIQRAPAFEAVVRVEPSASVRSAVPLVPSDR